MAVVRIETPAGTRVSANSAGERGNANYSEAAIAELARVIAETGKFPEVRALQIDFDAAGSEHRFYSSLLQAVRKELPPETRLSITALASWCAGDRWLEDLPPGTIDEAVPMLFRMGQGSSDFWQLLRSRRQFTVASCRNSVGVSVDELLSRDILNGKFAGSAGDPSGKRIYIFSPRAWTRDVVHNVMQEAGR
jgi:hypothetical protein